MIICTSVFFLLILINVFFETEDFWIEITGVLLLLNGFFICPYYKYGKDLRHGSKLLICGTLTNKQWFWKDQRTHTFYTVDGNAFEYEPVDMGYSDNVELQQPIEIHWLIHSDKMLYVKKGTNYTAIDEPVVAI